MTRGKTYQCVKCQKTFSDDDKLFKHIMGSRCKTCFYCNTRFRTPAEIKSHMIETHSRFCCKFCPRGTNFFLRSKFENHMQQQHLPVILGNIYLPGMEGRKSFNRFAERLRPNEEFYQKCDDITQRLENFMLYNTRYKKCRVLQGGSVGKGTDVKEEADLDLIVVLGRYADMDEYIDNVGNVLERLKQHIIHGDMTWARCIEHTRSTPFSVQFELKIGSDEDTHQIDYLPGYCVLPDRSWSHRQRLYHEMKDMTPGKRKYYSSCLSDLQVDFVNSVPENLKDVIRVIKHWLKGVKKEKRCTTVRMYFCELVAIDIWMANGSLERVSTANYVRQVIVKLALCSSIRIVWDEEQYRFNEFVPEEDRPMVLDPANPFRNIAPSRRDAATISEAAIDVINNSVRNKKSGLYRK